MTTLTATSLASSGRRIETRWIVRFALLAGLLVYFSFAGRAFLSTGNVFTIMETFALLGMVAIGMAVTMIAGEFDLSIGAMVSTAGIVALEVGQSSVLVGVAGALAFGLAIGLLNGALVAYLRMHSMVVTVASLIVVAGIGAEITDGRGAILENFELSASLTTPVLDVLSDRSIITIAVFVVVGWVLWTTRLGRDIVAVGSDRRAAAAAGVRSPHALLCAFAFSGCAGALAGSLLAYSLASAQPEFSGGGQILLQGATAAIIGGVALTGGRGSVRGVAFGTLTLAILNNGLSSAGASGAAISLANGGMLLLIVFLDAQATALDRRLGRFVPRLRAPASG